MASPNPVAGPANEIRMVVAAASAGSFLAFYDFFLFANLAPLIASRFFPDSTPTAALLLTIATFATSFVARPFGALVFGRLGDLTGRKPAFSLSLLIMGVSTFAIGLVPGFDRIGLAAPAIILLLRLLQGLALGGDTGGAMTYTAEASPAAHRGLSTAWIQASALLGLVVSLGAILMTRYALDPDQAISVEKFNAWGWRIPFLLSILLVAVSAYIRSKLPESPAFTRLKPEGILSSSSVPPRSLLPSSTPVLPPSRLLLTLLGATMGQGVLFCTGTLFALSFLEKTCHIDLDQSKTMLLIAFVPATPLVLLFGRWSDRIGRKGILLGGMLLAVLSWPFLFHELPAIPRTEGRTELTARKEIRSTVSFIGKSRDLTRTTETISYYADGMQVVETKEDTVFANGRVSANPKSTLSSSINTRDYWKIIAILFGIAFSISMVCGPIAALLADFFPARIRYTSLSLAYEIGNGIFGGLVPWLAVLLTTAWPGNKEAGLWYPLGITVICFVIGALAIPSKGRKFAHVD
ncbi:MAG TPA: MFS transporter [Puia sp.]|nr:MFS transporter [Puia sp.]